MGRLCGLIGPVDARAWGYTHELPTSVLAQSGKCGVRGLLRLPFRWEGREAPTGKGGVVAELLLYIPVQSGVVFLPCVGTQIFLCQRWYQVGSVYGGDGGLRYRRRKYHSRPSARSVRT